MNTIENKIRDIEIISKQYEDLRKALIPNQDIIVGYLKELIDKYAEDYSLIKRNSVRILKLYNIVFRVKEENSFSEKLIRNNDYNLFQELFQDPDNINEASIKTKIKELDDLIGIKILTDLNIDSINMFKLITSANFQKDAESKGILLNQSDISKQPVPMKNGLPIFKIRCKYESWNFELQIKSKLESAWGDMEHAIFYKDYKITPVRGFAQNSMNHIGKLLLEIDDFLKEIRHANENFTTNSNALLFINKFEEKYSSDVCAILNNINYNFGKIASLSYNIHNSGYDILKAQSLSIDHLSLSCEKYEKYINHRNTDFDLQIFESIYFSNLEYKIEQNNIEENLDELFADIKKSYKNIIYSHNVIQDEDRVNEWTELFFDTCVKYDCREFLLNTENVTKHFTNLNYIVESVEVLELEPDQLNQILEVYTIFVFKGDFENFFANIDKDDLLNNLERCKNEIHKIKKVDEIVTDAFSSIINKLG